MTLTVRDQFFALLSIVLALLVTGCLGWIFHATGWLSPPDISLWLSHQKLLEERLINPGAVAVLTGAVAGALFFEWKREPV